MWKKNFISQTEIKNALSSTFGKVTKFNLKIYAYVYDELISFPRNDMAYDTITTNRFFTNVHKLIKVKFNLHYSHIAGIKYLLIPMFFVTLPSSIKRNLIFL